MKPVCIVCGKTIPYKFHHGKQQQYCDQTCFHNRFKLDNEKLLQLLNQTDNVTITADLMGIHRETLYSYLKRNNIRRIIQWA
jgi:transcriptional regulator of acetoin/glycerol metabolism